jgi:Tfp pilus assembly PilM family ATPase
VSEVFLSGGGARGELIVNALQLELLVPCNVWNPTGGLQSSLSSEQAAELESVSPQLAVAIGVGLSAL